MRVRAPQADFWRGQTFADVRRPAVVRRRRPRHAARRSQHRHPAGARRHGSTGGTSPVDRFVQTFYVEADMPNVIFAAYRPVQAIVDADVWTRDDGAIRASTVLGAGIDLHRRVGTTAGDRGATAQRRLRRPAPQPRSGRRCWLATSRCPTARRRRRSRSPTNLAAGKDVDLRRDPGLRGVDGAARRVRPQRPRSRPPVPTPSTTSCSTRKRGFCEQIASALAIMLRTQGVPTRVATGYAAGTRDRIAGVYEVRASDAHAWVEVWFPATGWQAFDPTASVPLSGEQAQKSVGGELATGVSRIRRGSRRQARSDRRHRPRDHRRGCAAARASAPPPPWPLGSAPGPVRIMAERHGAPDGASNGRRAASWTGGGRCSRRARESPSNSTASPSIPTFSDDDAEYDATRDSCAPVAAKLRLHATRTAVPRPRRYPRSDVASAGSHVRPHDGRAGVRLRRDVHGARRFPRRVRHRRVLAGCDRRHRVPRLVRLADRAGPDRRPRPRPPARAVGLGAQRRRPAGHGVRRRRVRCWSPPAS